MAYANTTVRRGQPLARDPVVRRQLANIATDIEVLRMLFYRNGWLIKEGLPTPYESAMNKVLADETGQKLAALGMELLGLYGPLKEGRAGRHCTATSSTCTRLPWDIRSPGARQRYCAPP